MNVDGSSLVCQEILTNFAILILNKFSSQSSNIENKFIRFLSLIKNNYLIILVVSEGITLLRPPLRLIQVLLRFRA